MRGLLVTVALSGACLQGPPALVDAGGAVPDASPADAGIGCFPGVPAGDSRLGAGGGCYVRFDMEQTWSAARDACLAVDAHLTTDTTPEETAILAALVQNGRGHWIGLWEENPEVEGSWAWVTGEPFELARWGGLEPNDALGGEDCAAFHADTWWSDLGCDVTREYLCEREE